MTRRWTQPQHRPDPHRTAVTAASTLLDHPDWWAETRREFRHLATRRGLAQLREA